MTEGDDRSRRDHGRLILGVLLIAAGAVWLADAAGASIPWAALLPLVLVAVGLVLITGKAAGARGALIAVGIAISLVLAARASIPGVIGFSVVGDGVGERAERPTEVTELLPSYRLGVGSLTVDLSDVDFPSGTTRVAAEVGIGELAVLVPPEVGIELVGEVGVGEVRAPGVERSGVGVVVSESLAADPPSDATLVLELSVGIGQAEVSR